MAAVIVRYTTRPECADENARLVEAVYDELASSAPDRFHYATFRLSDGVTFVHVAVVEGDDNPLSRSEAFAAFQAGIADRCADGPHPQPATVVGSYRMLT